MERHAKFAFVGNRSFVLNEMLARKLELSATLVCAGSYLERELEGTGLPFSRFSTKAELLELLNRTDCDVLVSNGCPYVLPVSKLAARARCEFVNVHPSLLPDLRGRSPVNGAILFERDAGATCHIMDDAVDAGDIVSQVKIPYSKSLDAALLYQLSFMAEAEAFALALDSSFEPRLKQAPSADAIYYSRREEDMEIDFSSSACEIVRRVKAFNVESQGAFFRRGERLFKVFGARIVDLGYLPRSFSGRGDSEILMKYGDAILLRKDGAFLELQAVEGDLDSLALGEALGGLG